PEPGPHGRAAPDRPDGGARHAQHRGGRAHVRRGGRARREPRPRRRARGRGPAAPAHGLAHAPAPLRGDGVRGAGAPGDGRVSRREAAASAALLVVLLAGWEAITRGGLVHQFILPAPTAVADALRRLITPAFLRQHLAVTLGETLAGFALGSGVAFLAGAALHAWPFVSRVVYPYIVLFQVVPKVALAPIFITWFGFGLSSKIVMAATISFFPTLVNTIVGLGAVSEDARMLFRSLVARRRDTFLKLQLPAALPYVFA